MANSIAPGCQYLLHQICGRPTFDSIRFFVYLLLGILGFLIVSKNCLKVIQ